MDCNRTGGKIHAEETAVLYYNDEQALRSVIKLAYFSYKDHYLKFEELPAGDGYADIVYFPKKTSPMPALIIELKWNQSAKGAIDQIKEKNILPHWPVTGAASCWSEFVTKRKAGRMYTDTAA